MPFCEAVEDGVAARRAVLADAPLFSALFAAHKAPEFEALHLAPPVLQSMLDMQHRAQRSYYATTYPHAQDTVLLLNGIAVGRQLVDRQVDAYRIIDLAVLPAYRNRGVGSWALQQMQHIAMLEQVPLRLSVQKANPAVRLYQRLGFTFCRQDELSLEMEWRMPHHTVLPADTNAGCR